MSEQAEIRLPGGNVGGAVRVGETVRRAAGPWSPAVHALLDYLAAELPAIPRVHGYDEQGREVLSYLPGWVPGECAGMLSSARLVSVLRWTRRFHQVVAGFSHPGPWRFFPVGNPTLIGHNDIAPYNICFDGNRLTGVFDWDLAGPSTPLLELAFIAWNCVPLHTDIGPEPSARRLRLIASVYGPIGPQTILHAVPLRIETMLDGIPVAAAAGDQGMANLMLVGEPDRSRVALAGLVDRIPAIDRALGGLS
jgi:Phosphotransferase enzyme family